MAKLALSGAFRLQPFEASEDPDVAPGAYTGPDPAPPWTLARARQNMLWIYVLGLVFLGFSVASLVLSNPTPGLWVYAIAVLVAIAVGYALAAWMCDASLRWRWAYLGLFVLLVVAAFPFLAWGVVYYGIYVCILFSTLIPGGTHAGGILVTAVAVMVLAVVTGQWAAISIGLSGLLVGWATGAGIESGRVSSQLASTRHRVAVLSVAAERERIGRDLHDILGHSLTAISIKAGLAARLVDQDATAARSEISDIEGIARQALDDVRATASGYREVSLATEIASARSVLLAAGIEARAPSAVEPVSRTVSELFGYVVREAVTNVVRHSEATTCTVELTRDSVSITDDGRGFATSAPAGGSADAGGSGLSGLAGRVDAAGGRLSVRSEAGRGTVVRAELLTGLTGSTAQVVTPAELGVEMTIRILLADDQAMIRQAFSALLQLEPDLEVVGQAADGAAAVARAAECRPDVVLMDIQMPGADGIDDGIAATHRILARDPGVRVIILTTFGRPGYLRRAMESGAVGFMVKDAPAERLIEGIRRVHRGLRVVDPALAAASLSLGSSPLTERETDVLTAASRGGSTGMIARSVYLSEGTVRNHLSAAMGKLGAGSRAEAVRIATDNGWLS